jgi:hypothetical protein
LNWRWSFLRPDDASGVAVESFGQLATNDNPDANGFYTITSIEGTRNGVPILELIASGTAIPGNCDNASTCYSGDNLLRVFDWQAAQLTINGFGVALADGSYANYFFADYLVPPVYREYHSVAPFGDLPPGPEDSELNGVFRATRLAAVPAPPPLAGVLLSLAWIRRWRQRSRGLQD